MKRGGGSQRNNVLAIDALDRPTTEYRFHSPVLHGKERRGRRLQETAIGVTATIVSPKTSIVMKLE